MLSNCEIYPITTFNRNVQLWKITYANGIINLSPCTSFLGKKYGNFQD